MGKFTGKCAAKGCLFCGRGIGRDRAHGVQRGAARIACGGADCLSRCEALGSPLADSTNLNVIHALGFWAL